MNATSAEMTQSPDRLDHLSKTLAQGAYNPDDLDLPASAKMNVSLRSQARNPKEVNEVKEDYKKELISPSDYVRFKISPLVTDSEIHLVSNSKESFFTEVKYLPNGLMVLRYINDNSVVVTDLNNENPSKNSWYVACVKDHITDERNCALNKFAFAILKADKFPLTLSVSNEFTKLSPNYLNFIRIDSNPPHKVKGVFRNDSASRIINEMKKGQMAYTRFYEQNGEKYEENINLNGFSLAYDLMNKMYERLK